MRRRISGWTVGVSLAILAAIAALVLWPKPEIAKEPVNFGGLIMTSSQTFGDSILDTTVLHPEWAWCENNDSSIEMRYVGHGCSVNQDIFIADSIRRWRGRGSLSQGYIDSLNAQILKDCKLAEDRRIERIVRKVLKEQARSVKQTRDTTFPTRYINLDSIIRSYQIDTAIRQGTIPNVVPMPMPMIFDSIWRRCADPHESLPIWEDLRKRRIENRYPETTGGVWKGVPKP